MATACQTLYKTLFLHLAFRIWGQLPLCLTNKEYKFVYILQQFQDKAWSFKFKRYEKKWKKNKNILIDLMWICLYYELTLQNFFYFDSKETCKQYSGALSACNECGTHFIHCFWANSPNPEKNMCCSQMKNRSGNNFAQVMTAQLSWHVQKYFPIGWIG